MATYTPTTQKYLNTQPGSLEAQLTERKTYRDMEDAGIEALGPLHETLEELYIQIPVSGGSNWHSTCKVIRPRGPSHANRKRPLIVMFHGGGFIRGSPESFTRPGREFAQHFDAVVVSVEYRLAPEWPWPTAVHDAWDVTAYLARAVHTGDVKIFGAGVEIDESAFVLGGVSAGASIACAVLGMALLTTSTSTSASAPTPTSTTSNPQWARESLGITVSGIYLGVPFLLDDEMVPAEYTHDFTSRQLEPRTADIIKDCIRMYKPDLHSHMFSPINLPASVLTRWPRTYFQVGEQDVWRDDALIVGRMLEKNGAHVKIDKYSDLAHVTWSVFTTGSEMDINSELGRNTMAGMKWLLGA